MTTPPRPSDRDMADAIERIYERRRRVDDEFELLSDDPRLVLEYLMRRSGRDLPVGVRAEEVADGLILRHWLWWQGEAFEAWLLASADKAGIPLPRVAVMLGATTGPAVSQRRHRLSLKLSGRPPLRKYHPDARDMPAPASAAASSPTERTEPVDVLRAWLDRNREVLERYAAVLIAHEGVGDFDLGDDAYSSVVDLRSLTRDASRGVGWFVQLTETTVALGSEPAVQALAAQHPLRRTLARLDQLTDEWAALHRTKRPAEDAAL
ncbi:hypothetical protein [Catellatospora sp. NPDC049133]|uniref:hypothetical protein n=1 Tax=Catellatospora sp. NPDC049133 TaxID=3155499 RepID=UPI0033F1312C